MEKQLGKNIDLICKRWGWGYDRLGKKWGLGRNAVGNYVHSITEPNLARVLQLEMWTGISALRIYYDTLDPAEIPELPRLNTTPQERWQLQENGAESRTKQMYQGTELVQVHVDLRGLEAELAAVKQAISDLQERVGK